MEGSVYGVYNNTNRTIEEKLQEFMMVMARIGKYVTVTKYCWFPLQLYILVTMLCIASIRVNMKSTMPRGADRDKALLCDTSLPGGCYT